MSYCMFLNSWRNEENLSLKVTFLKKGVYSDDQREGHGCWEEMGKMEKK